MARIAQAFRPLAYHLYPHESLVQERRFGPGFELLQREQIVRIKIEAVKMDSTIVKVHPDGTGALKKTDPRPSENPAADGPPRFIWLPRMLERP